MLSEGYLEESKSSLPSLESFNSLERRNESNNGYCSCGAAEMRGGIKENRILSLDNEFLTRLAVTVEQTSEMLCTGSGDLIPTESRRQLLKSAKDLVTILEPSHTPIWKVVFAVRYSFERDLEFSSIGLYLSVSSCKRMRHYKLRISYKSSDSLKTYPMCELLYSWREQSTLRRCL